MKQTFPDSELAEFYLKLEPTKTLNSRIKSLQTETFKRASKKAKVKKPLAVN